MSNNIRTVTKTTSDSFPIFAVLGCVLIVLKLMHLIDISWVWVFAPWWIPWSIVLGYLFGIFLVWGVCIAFATIFG